MNSKVNTIFWDWNGTLLADVDICVDSINTMLKKRNLPLISRDYYREIFTFPVKEYYQIIGFDFSKESFENLAVEFIDLYTKSISEAVLNQAAANMLKVFKQKNYKQYIISAMEHQQLMKSVENLGIKHYFSHISGIADIYANDKVNNAKNLMEICGEKPERICLIGDTLHDFDVAEKIGIQSVLVANGHQSEERLLRSGTKVIKNLHQLL